LRKKQKKASSTGVLKPIRLSQTQSQFMVCQLTKFRFKFSNPHKGSLASVSTSSISARWAVAK